MYQRMVFVACMVVLAVAGCKSKETTSAIIHNQTGRYDMAIQTAQEALAKDPNDAEAHFQLALAYSQLDTALDTAYDNFMKAAELDKSKTTDADNNIRSNYARHYNKALALMKSTEIPMADLKEAAQEFEYATQADPREAKGFYMLGTAYARMGNEDPSYYEKAIPVLDKVLELASPSDKHYIDALSLAGTVLARAGRPEEAESRFNRLVEEDPTNYRVIESIGNDLLAEEDWVGAAVFLELAAKARKKIGAEDFTLYYNIGVAYFQAREADPQNLMKSVEYYEKALEVQPDEPQTILNIVKSYFAAEDWRQAAIWGEKYVALKADDGTGWLLLARIYQELGDNEKSRQCSARAEELRG